MEQEIKNQLFPNANLTVKIYERFELSAQYTPEKLMGVYRDSILAEIVDKLSTNTVGDGKIFISDIDDVVRIRTGEHGKNVL